MKQKINQRGILLILGFIIVAVYLVSISNTTPITGSTTKEITAEVSRKDIPVPLTENQYFFEINQPKLLYERKITLTNVATPSSGLDSAVVIKVEDAIETVRPLGASTVEGLFIKSIRALYDSKDPLKSTAILEIIEVEPKALPVIEIPPPIQEEEEAEQGVKLTCSSLLTFKKLFSNCDSTFCQQDYERRLCEERGFWIFKSSTEICEKLYETSCTQNPDCNVDKLITASSCSI